MEDARYTYDFPSEDIVRIIEDGETKYWNVCKAFETDDEDLMKSFRALFEDHPVEKAVREMKHKAIRVDNLMYKGCEPHWKCTLCGFAVPFHCYTKEEFENMCCGCHKINCKNCNQSTEKG